MADNVIREFLVSLGYKSDGAEKFGADIDMAQAKAVALGQAMYDTAKAVATAVADMASGLDKLYWQSQTVGSSAGDIKALGYAYSQLGGSASDASAAIQAIANFNTSYGAGARGFLTRLGVDPKDIGDSAKTLIDLEAIFKRMVASGPNGMARANAVAGFLGISSDQLRLMLRDTGEYEQHMKDFARSVGLNLDDAAGKSNQFMTTFREKKAELGLLFDYAELKILEQALPLMAEFTKEVTGLGKAGEVTSVGLPILIGLIGAAGTAALVAAGPYIALAAAIAGVVAEYQLWQRLHDITPEKRKEMEGRSSQIRQEAWNAFNTKDDVSIAERFGRAFGVMSKHFDEGVHALDGNKPGPAPSGGRGGPRGSGSQVIDYFKSQGANDVGARGIAAMLFSENNKFDPNGRNPTSGAWGIAQWLSKDRIADFKRLFGHDIHGSTFAEQLRFVQYELTHKYRDVWRAMRNAPNPLAAAQIGIHGYESPGRFGEMIDTRNAARFLGMSAGAGRAGVTQTNNYNITGSDPHAIADAVGQRQEQANRQLTTTHSVYQW